MATAAWRASTPDMTIRGRSLLPGTEKRSLPVRVLLTTAACLHAVKALATGRIDFARQAPADILANNRRIAGHARSASHARQEDPVRVAQVKYAVMRMARFVPWRSDCLVQALAAQKWLESYGIAANLVIGVDPLRPQGFHAHAWLTYGEELVTGSNNEGYEPLSS
ncbi:lasso peptide biosynthesis B2 protein [Aurantiacibacter odishensis]|uniref:lasso peptide biosynthesis B2 protein n=1 Tax=Aurantiacibacter odishensis TaxID=1155476 RepID=UPI00196B968C|nr:lasso peptide biosynthesis B2 protein [Aurantiacibacter odishensis]